VSRGDDMGETFPLVEYERGRKVARARLEAAQRTLAQLAMHLSADETVALAQRLEVLTEEAAGTLPKTFAGYELGAEVEVVDSKGRWIPGTVAKHLDSYDHPTVSVRVPNPPADVPAGSPWLRRVGEPLMRRRS
jgi:hypothetical protein